MATRIRSNYFFTLFEGNILTSIITENFGFLRFKMEEKCRKMCFSLNTLKMKMVAMETDLISRW